MITNNLISFFVFKASKIYKCYIFIYSFRHDLLNHVLTVMLAQKD